MDKKVTGIVAYITIIGWIIAYLAGDKENAKFHLNQALVINIISIIISLAAKIIGIIPILGWIVAVLLSIVNLVLFAFAIVGIIYACQDQDKPLPIIGGIKILK